MGDAAHHFTNVYVKNFSDKLDDAKLRELFEKYGPIASCTVMKDHEGKSRGFGFVSFEGPEDAEKAVQELDGYSIPDSELKLTVCRAQKKAEREAELSRVYEQLKAERLQRYQGVNLVSIKNRYTCLIFKCFSMLKIWTTLLTVRSCVGTLSNMELLQAPRLCWMTMAAPKALDLSALRSLVSHQ